LTLLDARRLQYNAAPMQQFKARLEPVPGGGNYVVVPPEIATAAGLKYGARVRGTLEGVDYRSSLMMYSGIFHLGVHKATIAAAKVGPGADVEVTIEIDDKPLPTDSVPKDLQAAIDASKAAQNGWALLAPSHKREHVKHVTEAKKPETRDKRIATAVAAAEARAATSTKPRVVSAARKAPKAKATPRAKTAKAKTAKSAKTTKTAKTAKSKRARH
jgi:hypothetical protein